MPRAPLIAVDTSVAVPLMVATHSAHTSVSAWAAGTTLRLSGHAAAETYSVLTRLPGDLRLAADDAVTLIRSNFAGVLTLRDPADAHEMLARAGVTGGAVYDGLVALAARDGRALLATRDARARITYEALGVRVDVVPT